MQVDFYQLGATPLERVIAGIAARLLEKGERALVVAGDSAALARLDRLLWDEGRASFLPHGLAGGTDDARQPVLLSTSPDSPNRARNLIIADGEWREAALSYDRSFYLFDQGTLAAAREAWKSLADKADVERRYWAQDGNRWTQKA